MRNYRRSLFKDGLKFSWGVSLFLSLLVVIGVFFTFKDMSPLVTICGFSWGETAVYDAVYAHKSKCENKAKYAQSFVKTLADQYGIEAITPIITSVISD